MLHFQRANDQLCSMLEMESQIFLLQKRLIFYLRRRDMVSLI
jgi:hypothetical protein